MSETHNKPTLGAIFRRKREEKGLLVRQVAAVTELDQAIISRIENSDRLPTREQLTKLAGLYDLDLKETYSAWLAERMIRDYGDEPYAPEAFLEVSDTILKHSSRMNEPRALYNMFPRNSSRQKNPDENPPSKQDRKPKNTDNDESKT